MWSHLAFPWLLVNWAYFIYLGIICVYVRSACSLFEFFNNVDEAKAVFVRGARKAKGTTTETGLVESYFANPFGPVQLKDQTDPLIDKYFEKLFDKNIKVGQLRTRLAIEGQEHSGPRKAAEQLLAFIKEQ